MSRAGDHSRPPSAAAARSRNSFFSHAWPSTTSRSDQPPPIWSSTLDASALDSLCASRATPFGTSQLFRCYTTFATQRCPLQADRSWHLCCGAESSGACFEMGSPSSLSEANDACRSWRLVRKHLARGRGCVCVWCDLSTKATVSGRYILIPWFRDISPMYTAPPRSCNGKRDCMVSRRCGQLLLLVKANYSIRVRPLGHT
ncbi:uncharacterized protein B0I36DRAFT_140113 [Microdochium trichocladiopsis]|uniref:Uncharacterized protein n=1 Tax=Microdochium trichocladiopsis TaxID=1682393 RepID=A0A9P8Y310_9PEZI|nr:uncharacterized protein B0I36DRAFT_140113 [Microdochium trichocladiopsis]KAH7027554.1 hypothetical protein B0I36DRAFT_140113 [Microdochium trichocladiopsis]